MSSIGKWQGKSLLLLQWLPARSLVKNAHLIIRLPEKWVGCTRERIQLLNHVFVIVNENNKDDQSCDHNMHSGNETIVREIS
jgi:hypothetical protein